VLESWEGLAAMGSLTSVIKKARLGELASPVRAQSLVETVVKRLENAIFAGELLPGTKLSEQGLAQSLGISRGPLREALRRLEGRKLIERVPNIGARVTSLSDDDLRNIMDIREALEGAACRSATIHMSDAELDQLQQLLKSHGKQKGVARGTAYYQSKDFDFHLHIIDASRNQRLKDMLSGDLYDLLRVYRYKLSQVAGRTADSFKEHEQILAAMMARDPDRAEARMRTHIRNAKAHLEATLAAELKAAAG
jgi:DNA-binding GntR family transcriptional regulator